MPRRERFSKRRFQKHVPAKAEMAFPVLEKNSAKTKESKQGIRWATKEYLLRAG
jgi:hypothetical protein